MSSESYFRHNTHQYRKHHIQKSKKTVIFKNTIRQINMSMEQTERLISICYDIIKKMRVVCVRNSMFYY